MPSVLGIAIRTSKNGPMREVDSAEVVAGGGISTDLPVSRSRGLTLLASEQWSEVRKELDAPLPWHTRRANVLVEGLKLGDLIGRRLKLGEIEFEVINETEPCGLMDQLHAGLREALKPECRGGVHGCVVRGGTLRIGDSIELIA